MPEPADDLVSVAPDAPLPAWELSWANIWIDRQGGQHWSRYSHGSTFEGVFDRVMGRPVDRDENNWMFDNVGSVGDAEDDEDDNPGWQFNELAIESLGWVRVKAYHLDGLEPSWTISCRDSVTQEALQSVVRLLSGQPKDSHVELGLFNELPDDLRLNKALLELRTLAKDASPAADGTPAAPGPRL